MKVKSLLVVVAAYLLSEAVFAAPDTTRGSWYGTNGLDGALRGRDAHGNPVNLLIGDVPNPAVKYVYDSEQDITWLQDWNYSAGDGGSGLMKWEQAVAWAGGLSLGGFDDWRLPHADPGCGGFDCTGSEMGHLFLSTLGNPSGVRGSVVNTGPFLNMQAEASNPDGNSVKWTYWTNTRNLDVDRGAFVFETVLGAQTSSGTENQYLFAVAVRPGDVFAVPEPSTLELLLVALAFSVGFTRFRPHVVSVGTHRERAGGNT